MDVLVIYQFCTFGGVERVLLNRAQAFRKYGLDVNISVGYLHDRGALSSFEAYIHANGLRGKISPFLIPKDLSIDWNRFDHTFIIDTPQVFEASASGRNIHVECHTPYKQSRQYLKQLPKHIKGIFVPAHAFKTLLESEFESLPEIQVFPNPVSDEFFNLELPVTEKIFTRSPITYFARVEDLKNFIEASRIFETLSKIDELMFWVVGEGADEKQVIHSLERKGLISKSLLRDRVDFERVPDLVRLVKQHRGLFLSPSKGESFGLSAAEFISGGVPVLLSNIPPHRELVNEDERFLYPLGDVLAAKEKLLWASQHWDEASQVISDYGKKFEGQSFIRAWQSFLENHK